MSIQSEALQNYFQERRIKNKEIAEATGASEPVVSNILNGKKGISAKMAKRFKEVYGFSTTFLQFGEGVLISPSRPINVNQENVSVGGDNIIASTTTTNNTTNQTTEGSDTSMLKKMCHDLLERVMELEQENCALRCKLNSQKHE